MLRSKRDSLTSKFVECTKLDVAMNALLVRSKHPALNRVVKLKDS